MNTYLITYYIADPERTYEKVILAESASKAIDMFNESTGSTDRKSKKRHIVKVEMKEQKEKLPEFRLSTQSKELWDIIKKYYHKPDAPISKVTVYLRLGVGSGIFCEYVEGYESAFGNTSLNDANRDGLFKELKEKKFIPDIKYIQEATIGITEYELPKIGILYVPVKSL